MNLFEHQETALKQTEGRNRVAYYHDMGLGKTFTGAEKMIRCGTTMNLVICQKSKIQDWVHHFEDYYPYPVFDLTNKHVYDRFLEILKSCEELTYEQIKFGTCHQFAVINYELAWRRKDLLRLSRLGSFTLMLDESSLIQNKRAKQTKFILKLQSNNVILLSGTPTNGKYENLWTQMHLLGWPISEALYQRQYVNWKEIHVPGGQIIRVVDRENPYKNVDRLKKKMREHGAHFLKTEEVMNLPEQTFIEISISKPKYYSTFLKTGIVEIDGSELVGDTNLTKRLYARQICGVYSSEKFAAFRDLIQSTTDRIVVFYNFTAELSKLLDVAHDLERPCAIVNGETKDLRDYELYSDSVVFIQYQAGAMGLNLQKANKIVYFSLPERSELFEQSKKRIHRIGQGKPCFYYLMICKNTVEESIYKALQQRRDFTDELFREM